jgi:hypothetical protein
MTNSVGFLYSLPSRNNAMPALPVLRVTKISNEEPALFVLGGVRLIQERFDLRGIVVLSSEDSYPNEPGFVGLEENPTQASVAFAEWIAIAQALWAQVNRLVFYSVPNEWPPQTKPRYVRGTVRRFELEFEDIFPWGQAVLIGQQSYTNIADTPVIFEFQR